MFPRFTLFLFLSLATKESKQQPSQEQQTANNKLPIFCPRQEEERGKKQAREDLCAERHTPYGDTLWVLALNCCLAALEELLDIRCPGRGRGREGTNGEGE